MFHRSVLFLILFSLLLAACASQDQQMPAEDKGMEGTVTPIPAELTPTLAPPEEKPAIDGPQYAPMEPLPDEDKMIRGTLSVGESEIILMESYPVQVSLKVSGMLPTPCHMPRAEVTEPDENNEIHVEMWTLTDPDAMCIQVLQPFETSIPLGSYESGMYSVYLNGKQVGDFSL